jgi:hypothetical protein
VEEKRRINGVYVLQVKKAAHVEMGGRRHGYCPITMATEKFEA